MGLSAVPYAVAAVAMLLASRFSDRIGNRRDFVWPFLLASTGLFVASTLLGTGSYWISYAVLVLAAAGLYAPYGPYFALMAVCLFLSAVLMFGVTVRGRRGAEVPVSAGARSGG